MDFVNAPDEMIAALFMNSEEQRSLQLNYPPKTHRRTAQQIREWIHRRGKRQKGELMDASASIEIETKFGVGGTTLCWNGSSWEERAVDDGPPSHAGSSSVQHQHPTMAQEGRCGCPGVTLELIRNMRFNRLVGMKSSWVSNTRVVRECPTEKDSATRTIINGTFLLPQLG